MAPSKPAVRATQTSFRIVEALRELDGAGVTKLATHLDLSKSAVHKHLATLADMGYVRKEETTYYVGYDFLAVGEYARRSIPLYRVARPKLEELAGVTDEQVSLMIEDGGMGIYLFRTDNSVEADDVIVGDRVPLVSTAPGRAILAHLPKQRVLEILDAHGLPEDSPFDDRGQLQKDLRRIRDRDLAFERREESGSATGVAVAIRTPEGRPAGAIAVTGTTDTMSGKRLVEDITGLIASTAKEIELEVSFD